jgi:DNA-directed RNA polymerase subunit RPC12/RpoP
LGAHTISSIGFTADGRELSSNELRVNFISSAAGMQAGMKIVIPVLVVVLGSMLLGLVIPALIGRGKRSDLPLGAPRKYGISGGTICPRCGRPFGMHLAGFNLSPIHKLDRCPYCGKWGLLRRRSQAELQAAEAAELRQAEQSGQFPILSEEEKFRRDLENSRYQDI